MSSRQQEKERRRAEREAVEQAALRSQARKARLQLGIAALATVAAIAVAVLVFGRSSGGDSAAKEPGAAAAVKLPAPKETDLKTTATTAGCTLKTFPAVGDGMHTTAKVTYKTNPPTSGAHNPVAAEDGLYEPGNAPELGKAVHSLEHGRIDIQYKAGTPQATIDKLETLGSEKLNFGKEGYHVLVFENNTKMPAAVAATAWTKSLTCPALNDGVYDAIRAFRTEYTDKGPELIP